MQVVPNIFVCEEVEKRVADLSDVSTQSVLGSLDLENNKDNHIVISSSLIPTEKAAD